MVCWTASREILPISRVVSFKFKIDGFSWVWPFLVSPALGVDCIVGADFIAKSGLVLDIHGHQCYFKFNRVLLFLFLDTRELREVSKRSLVPILHEISSLPPSREL